MPGRREGATAGEKCSADRLTDVCDAVGDLQQQQQLASLLGCACTVQGLSAAGRRVYCSRHGAEWV